MKTKYIAPEIEVTEGETEPVMLDTSIINGGEFGGGTVDAKRNDHFEFDEELEEEPEEEYWGRKSVWQY